MVDDLRPTPLDLVTFLPYACNQLEAPFDVIISTRVTEEYLSPSEKSKKVKREKSTMCTSQSRLSTDKTEPQAPTAIGTCHFDADADAVHLTAVFDALGQLKELEFRRTIVPTFLLKVIGLCLTFQRTLNRLTIRSCPMADNAVQEVSKFLPQSQISELCFDEISAIHCQYSSLLGCQSRLQYLSLDRCGLDDDDCAAMAAELTHPRPAARSLMLLSLASNAITDAGASALARMLRSNRQLRYLNLSGNQIKDAGATAIFSSLMQFPLTEEEVRSKRLRNLEYLKLFRTVYANCYKDLIQSLSEKVTDDRSSCRKRNAKSSVAAHGVLAGLAAQADGIALELVGPNDEPFSADYSLYEDFRLHCTGNLSLSYLDLSYNHLSRPSMLKLAEVLQYQSKSPRKASPGLLRVVVEGNPLPAPSSTLGRLQQLLEYAIAGQLDVASRKTDKRTTRKR